MKIILITILILTFGTMNFAQNDKILLADGTADEPKKYDLEPKVSELTATELDTVKSVALEKEIEFQSDRKQMSAKESNFRKDFELLDVAEGYFIYREIQFRAYLYTAYGQKMKRNYQGILVFRITNNNTKFTPTAHYVYEYRGDKYLQSHWDLNGNSLSNLIIFSQPPTKKYTRKIVRIIEFSPNGIETIGSKEIYSSVPQKQRSPYSSDKNKPAKRVYTPPIVKAIKLYAVKKLGKPAEFYEERWTRNGDFWGIMDKLQSRPSELEVDTVNYIEIIKPLFPKRLGEN